MMTSPHETNTVRSLLQDQERLRQALLADAPHGASIEDSVRSYLLRTITAQRSLRLIPNDVFESLLVAATNDRGRDTLLSFFGATDRSMA